MRGLRVLTVVVLFFVTVHASATPQRAVVVGGQGTPGTIPHGYHSYSLFLVCDATWLNNVHAAALSELYAKFALFGQAIGDRNASIWFIKQGESPLSSSNVDIDRSQKFCKAWHRDAAKGPYLVFTTTYPDEANLSSNVPGDNAVFSLNGMSSPQLADLLNALTLAITHLEEPPPSNDGPAANMPHATKPAMWVELLSSVQSVINKFGCSWTFSIDAGPAKADLKSCGQS